MTTNELSPEFWGHVEEHRKTVISCFVTIVVTTAIVLGCFEWLYPLITQPLETLSESPQLVLLGPLEGISATLKICFWVSCGISSPIWGFFILRFILPGLKTSERSLALPFSFWSLLAVVTGAFLAIEIMIPFTNRILLNFNESLGQNLWSVSHYLDYTLMLVLSAIIAAEFVVILFFLVHYGKISSGKMRRWRPIVCIGLFVLSAVITPPDIMTQLALALPLVVLYEVTICYARIREVNYVERELSPAYRNHPKNSATLQHPS